MHSRSDLPRTGDFPEQRQPSFLAYRHALLLIGNLKASVRLASVSGDVDSIGSPILNLSLATNPMPRRSTRKGTAFIEEIFYKTAIARRGGPVRRSVATIEREASLIAVFAAATARGWAVTQSGSYWQFTSIANRPVRVVGVDGAGKPLLAP